MAGIHLQWLEGILEQPAAQISGMWLSAIGALSFQVQPIMLGAFAQVYGLDDQQVGTLASIELGGGFMATLSAVIWLRRVNWRSLMLFLLPLIAVAFLGSGWCRNFTELAAIRFVGGLGHGAIYVVAVAYLCDSHKPERVVGFAVTMQLLLGAAMFVALPQLEHTLGIKGMVSLLALIAACGLLGLISFPAAGKSTVEAEVTGTARVVWPALLIVAGMLVFQMSLASIWAFIEIMADHSGIPLETTGTVLAITVPLSAMGGVAAGVLGLRWGRTAPLLLTAIATIIALSVLGTVATISALFIGFFIQQFFWNFGIAYIFGMVAEFDTTGRLVALAPSAQTLGNALAPGLTGLALTGDGYLVVNFVSGLCACVGIGALLIVIHYFPRAEHSDP